MYFFVAGVSAAATQGGFTGKMDSSSSFLFPAMLFILIVFRCGIFVSGDQLKTSIWGRVGCHMALGDDPELCVLN